MPNIAIIGGGFSGTLLALHLLRRCPGDVDISLIERSISFGRGAAYSTGNPSHLLNVPAGRMSAFHDQPHDFLDWLRQASDADVPRPVTEQSFVPRRLFGAYVRHLLNRELKTSGQSDRLKLIRGDARDIERADSGLVIHLDRWRSIETDLVVLAVGNFPPHHLLTIPRSSTARSIGPIHGRPNSFTDLDPQAPVLLIGTGLTMVDAAVSLLDRGHEGAIYALSRRGLLPQRHAQARVPSPRRDPVPTNLVELTRFLRRESRRAHAEGAGWQAVVDELRPFTLDVWADMSIADRTRFVRHLRPWWEIHRHRMAPSVAERIHAAIDRGQLRIRAGRVQSFRLRAADVDVFYRRRGTDIVESLTAVRVVNCSGPSCDYGRITHPLVRSLLESGQVRPDPMRLGLDVTSSCALKDRKGAISGRLFAVGPVTKGAFWEMTAVPDIRRQCEFLAGHIATLAKGFLSQSAQPPEAQTKPRNSIRQETGPGFDEPELYYPVAST